MQGHGRSFLCRRRGNSTSLDKYNSLYDDSNMIFKLEDNFVLYNNIPHLLRRVFVIFPIENENLKKFNPTIFLYYPIKLPPCESRFLPKAGNSIIICNSLRGICAEIFKICMLKIIDSAYKINIYNEKYCLITNDEQLSKTPKFNNTLYAKISKIQAKNVDNKKSFLMRSCYYHINPKPLFFSTSIQYGIRRHISLLNLYSSQMKATNISKSSALDEMKAASDLNNKNNINDKGRNTKDLFQKGNSKMYFSIDTSHRGNDSITNNSIYSLRRAFNPNIINENKIDKEQKLKFVYKNQNNRKKIKIIQLTELIDKNKTKEVVTLNDNDIEDIEYLNKIEGIYIEVNRMIRKFITENGKSLLTNGEVSFFDLKSNFLLMNEMETFPINSLKKEFIFYSFLSMYIEKEFKDIENLFYEKINKYNSEMRSIFKSKIIYTILVEVYRLFIKITNDRLYFVNQIKFLGEKERLRISYFFFVLFAYKNGKNILNMNKNVLFSQLESAGVKYQNEVNFQTYAHFSLFFKMQKHLNFMKKFIFTKDFFMKLYSANEKVFNEVISELNIKDEIKLLKKYNILSIKRLDNNEKDKIDKLFIHAISL